MFSLILASSLFFHMFSLISGEHFLENPITQKVEKPISITFDDGPHRVRTSAILDILHSENVPATFFVVGNRLPKEEDILRRMIREGHQVGNHSFSHPELPKLGGIDFTKEILLTNISIWIRTGQYPKYLRFPYGLGDQRVWNIFSGRLIGWDVDAEDWKAKNPVLLAQNIISQTKSGSIILLHDIKADTVIALPTILKTLKEKGYTFVSLDNLLPKTETGEQKKGIWLDTRKNIPIKKGSQDLSYGTELATP